MKMKLINTKTNEEIVNTTNQIEITTKLLYILWYKNVYKGKDYKQYYQYNYSDMQKIEFKIDTYKYIIEDIPVSMGILDSDKIEKLLKGGE